MKMNSSDFNRLIGLLSKLDHATNKAARTDGSFQKYYTSSIEKLKELPTHLKKLEQGLRTARVIE
jgi:hypothetical protein